MLLTAENYFSPEAEMAYMGSTQFKRFYACESHALAVLRGEWVEPIGTALLVGSYVDAHFSGSLDIFRGQHPEIYTRSGELKAEYRQAETIITRIERDPMMMRYLDGQAQPIMTGEIAGVPFKIKIDAYHPGLAIVDLKIMRDFAPVWKPDIGRVSFVEAWGYDTQGAIYQEVVRVNTGHVLPFIIAGATKETEPDMALISIGQDRLDTCLRVVQDLAPRYAAIKRGEQEPERCGVCNYCRHTRELSEVIDYRDMGVD